MLDILIPHYNDPKALALSLGSIAAQTWRGKMRAIVIDDGSAPDHLKAAQKVVADSKVDIEFIRNPENLGRPKTRNRLLDASTAPYIAWLDAGDVWYPNKIERQFETLFRLHYEGQDIDSIWVTCNYDWKWEGRRRRKVNQNVTGDQLEALFVGDRLRGYLWTLLGTQASFRMVDRFDERLTRLQDVDYFIAFVRGGGRLVVPEQDDPLCCYFKTDVGRNAREIRDCYSTIFAKHKPALGKYSAAFNRRTQAKADFVAARFAENNRKRWLSMSYRLNALVTDPRYALFRAKKYVLGK